MAKHDLTPHQERLIKRYYRHEETIRANRLSELLGELYLAETDKQRDRLWEKAEATLLKLGVEPATVERAVGSRDVERLGKLVNRVAGSTG